MSSPAPRPINFALAGCGSISATQIRALAALPADARLLACCDPDPAASARISETFGVPVRTWSEILNDPGIDAVTICTPSGLHGSLAAEALAAGKHVIVEKPMEVSVAACDALLAAQAASGRHLAIVSQHRFDPASRTAAELLARDELGRIHLVDAQIPWYRTQEYYDSGDWRGTWAMEGGGCLMNQGVHTVDLMLALAGPAVSVFAHARTAAHERIEVEDNVCATIEFASGAIGTLLASTSCYPGFPARLSLFGTEGSLVIDGDELKLVAIKGRETQAGSSANAHALQVATGGTRAASAAAADTTLATSSEWRWGDAHAAQFADFIAAIREDRPPLVTGTDGRRAVALIHAIYESSRCGGPVKL